MSKGCVLDLRLDDEQGTSAHDYSRYGNDGAVNGGVEWTEQGMRFDGSTGYLNCGNNESFNVRDVMTVSAWFKTNVYGDQIISKHNATGPFYLQTKSLTELRFMTFTSVGRADHDVTFAYQDGWHIMTGVYDSAIGKSKVYVDGSQIGSDVAQTGLLNVTTAKVFVGSYGENVGAGNFFNGIIDDVRIFNRALSAAEIYDYYESTKHKYV